MRPCLLLLATCVACRTVESVEHHRVTFVDPALVALEARDQAGAWAPVLGAQVAESTVFRTGDYAVQLAREDERSVVAALASCEWRGTACEGRTILPTALLFERGTELALTASPPTRSRDGTALRAFSGEAALELSRADSTQRVGARWLSQQAFLEYFDLTRDSELLPLRLTTPWTNVQRLVADEHGSAVLRDAGWFAALLGATGVLLNAPATTAALRADARPPVVWFTLGAGVFCVGGLVLALSNGVRERVLSDRDAP